MKTRIAGFMNAPPSVQPRHSPGAGARRSGPAPTSSAPPETSKQCGRPTRSAETQRPGSYPSTARSPDAAAPQRSPVERAAIAYDLALLFLRQHGRDGYFEPVEQFRAGRVSHPPLSQHVIDPIAQGEDLDGQCPGVHEPVFGHTRAGILLELLPPV